MLTSSLVRVHALPSIPCASLVRLHQVNMCEPHTQGVPTLRRALLLRSAVLLAAASSLPRPRDAVAAAQPEGMRTSADFASLQVHPPSIQQDEH